ncbi:MAG: IS200/IS605 family transposase [Prosthecobacter sp.]
MANTLTALHVHLVFSTKNREQWLRAEVEEDLWRYLGGICRAHDVVALQIGGMDDHVHLLLGIPPSLALSDVVRRIKGESSKWLSSEKTGFKGFAWQDGYGAFTVSKSHISQTIRYIQNQRQHQKKATFEEEYRKFLHAHDIRVDERYLFG